MNEQRLAFIEEFGVMFERMGTNRMLGRVWGALMVADPPEMTADELAKVLKASRGSISQATRQLIDIGVVQRINKARIRRDFYRVKPNAWREAFRKEQDSIAGMSQLFRRGLDAMEGSSDEARRSLEDAISFTRFWEQEMQLVLERWDTYVENQHGERHRNS